MQHSHILTPHTDKNSEEKFFPRLHSFCVGLPDSPDLAAAAKVAAFLGTIHHSYTYTIQEVSVAALPSSTVKHFTVQYIIVKPIYLTAVASTLNAPLFAPLTSTLSHLTPHTFFLPLQGIDAIRDVIYHLETFDTTTIRASTPMFLMSRKIKVSHARE